MLKRLKKRPLDYFKHSFYADTAVFGGVPATHAGFAFYDLDKIVFASDCPFDPEKGTMYTRETLRIIDGLDMPKAQTRKDLARQSRGDLRDVKFHDLALDATAAFRRAPGEFPGALC